jgi:hypothetical protein
MSIYDTKFLDCFETNLVKIHEATEKYSGKHSIDHEIADQFVENQVTKVRKQAARDLIDNTIYITLEEVWQIIESLIEKLYTENDLNSSEQIYMYVGDPNKSYYFICVLALHFIRKLGYKEPTHFITSYNSETFDEIGEHPFIIIDDVSYSGSQMSQSLNLIYYDKVIKNKKSPPNIFVLLIALNVISLRKLQQVPTHYNPRLKAYLNFIASPFKIVFLPERLYEPLIMKLGIERYFYLNIFFSPYTQNVPNVSLYLDHKLADEPSTYKTTIMYGQIVPNSYKYKDLIKNNNEGIFHIINPDLDPSIADVLLTNLRAKYKLSNKYSKHDIVYGFLVDRLIKLESKNKSSEEEEEEEEKEKEKARIVAFEKSIEEHQPIRFFPFINNCNQNPKLIENINDREIQNFDYRLFMLSEKCLENLKYTEDAPNPNDKCNIMFDIYYFNELLEKLHIDPVYAEGIIHKINSVICPISWYKSEFKMDCISKSGGKKTKKSKKSKKTKKIKKTKKSKKSKKSKKTKFY